MCCRLAQQRDGDAGHSPVPFPASPWLFLQPRNIVLLMPRVSKGTGMDQINESSFLVTWKGAGSQGLVLGALRTLVGGGCPTASLDVGTQSPYMEQG